MSYREPAGFFCTANMLLALILRDNNIDLDWHKDDLIFAVRDIYENLPPGSFSDIMQRFITWPFDNRVREIITFGKENNIPESAWLEAIERRAQNGS